MADVNKIVASTRVKNGSTTVRVGSTTFNKNPDVKDITLFNNNIVGQLWKQKTINFVVAPPGVNATSGLIGYFVVPINLNGCVTKVMTISCDTPMLIGQGNDDTTSFNLQIIRNSIEIYAFASNLGSNQNNNYALSSITLLRNDLIKLTLTDSTSEQGSSDAIGLTVNIRAQK